MAIPLWLGLWLTFSPPADGQAVLDGARYKNLIAPDEPPEPPDEGNWASRRTVELWPDEDGTRIRVRWVVHSREPRWIAERLFTLGGGLRVEKLQVDGKLSRVVHEGQDLMLATKLAKRSVVEVELFTPATLDRGLDLVLWPATRGKVVVHDPRVRARASGEEAMQVRVETDDPERPAVQARKEVWTGAGRVDVQLVPRKLAADERELAVAHVGVGVTVGDGELRGKAKLRWEVRRGELDRVSFDAPGIGGEVEVSGAQVRHVERSGDRFVVELQQKARDRVDLDVTWRAAVPKQGREGMPLPAFRPEAFRVDASLQFARDGDLEVVPHLEGWEKTAAQRLPLWGRGLVEGTPTASFSRGSPGGGSVDLLRFTPVERPPVVVDVAAYTAALTEEGRTLLRAHYEVRNERAANLLLRLPEGSRLIGVRVGGETAVLSRQEDGAWRVPLLRSVETVDGLLTFAVEVTAILEQDAWERKERRKLALPKLNAPVAVARTTVYLPPGYRNKLEDDEGHRVSSFDEGEGIAYGFSAGDGRVAEADALFQDAVQDWLKNDFEAAQGKLDALGELGANNENISRLQSNLDVVSGEREAADDETVVRRVKEQAQARARDKVDEQQQLLVAAEDSRRKGDYAEAEQAYRVALELGEDLAKLEQSESAEQAIVNDELRERLEVVEEQRKGKAEIEKRMVSAGSIGGKKKAPKKKAERKRRAKNRPFSTGIFRKDADASNDVLDPNFAEGLESDAVFGGDGRADSGAVDGDVFHPMNLDVGIDGTDTIVDTAPMAGQIVSKSAAEEIAVAPGVVPTDEEAPIMASPLSDGPVLADTAGDFDDDDGEEAEDYLEFEEEAMLHAEYEAEPEYERDYKADRRSARRSRGIGRGRGAGRGGGGGGGGLFKRKAKMAPSGAAAPMPPAPPASAPMSARARATAGPMMEPPADPVAAPEAPMESLEPPPEPDAVANVPATPELQRLPTPKATASALSIVVPAIGDQVLYQQLLLPAGTAPEVELFGQEPRRSKR